MSSQNDTLSRLLHIIEQQHNLDVSGVTLNTSLAELGLDSLAVSELLFSIEDEFEVNFGDIEPEAIPFTTGELVNLIESYQKQ